MVEMFIAYDLMVIREVDQMCVGLKAYRQWAALRDRTLYGIIPLRGN